MFHFYINLAYYIPHFYLFFRIRDNFIGKRYRLPYFVIYLILASVFPVIGIRPAGENFFMKALSSFSGYLLPFYLYVFLLVLLFDLFLLLNLVVKILSKESRKSYEFRLIVFVSILFLSAAIVTGGAINVNTIRISEYQVECSRKDSKLDHLRIAFVSDAHFQQDSPKGFVDQFVRKINWLNPDILLMGGDIVEGSAVNEKMEGIESILREIKTKYGVYSVLGNHEGYGNHMPDLFFKNSGIILLKDSVLKIDSAFYVAGRYDLQYRRRKTISNLIGKSPFNLPMILLDHHPNEIQKASLAPIDIQFSGHTHNGQLFPLNLVIHRMYDLAWGYKKIRNTHFFVSSGLRLWGPPVKTAGKAEIMIVDVKFR
jgi:predicted MPP superfamily phosphohydrolase